MNLNEELVNDFNNFFDEIKVKDIIKLDFNNNGEKKTNQFIVLIRDKSNVILANKINSIPYFYTLKLNSFVNNKITYFETSIENKKANISKTKKTITNVNSISVFRDGNQIKDLFGKEIEIEDENNKDDNSDQQSVESSLEVLKTRLFSSSNENEIITIFDEEENINFYFKIIEKLENELILMFIGGEDGKSTPIDMYKGDENKLFVLSKNGLLSNNGELNLNLTIRGEINEITSSGKGSFTFTINKPSNVNIINQTSDDEIDFTQDELRSKNLKSGNFKDATSSKQSFGNKMKAKLLNKLGIVTSGSGDNLGLLKAREIASKTGLTKHGHPFVSRRNKKVVLIINEIEGGLDKIDFSLIQNTKGVPSIFKVEKDKKIEAKFIDDNTIILLKGQSLPKYQIKIDIKQFLGNNMNEGIIFLEGKNNTASFTKIANTEYKIKFTIDH